MKIGVIFAHFQSSGTIPVFRPLGRTRPAFRPDSGHSKGTKGVHDLRADTVVGDSNHISDTLCYRGMLVAKNRRSILLVLCTICLARFNRCSDVPLTAYTADSARNGWSNSDDGSAVGLSDHRLCSLCFHLWLLCTPPQAAVQPSNPTAFFYPCRPPVVNTSYSPYNGDTGVHLLLVPLRHAICCHCCSLRLARLVPRCCVCGLLQSIKNCIDNS